VGEAAMKQMVKLWLDDIRDEPKGWVRVRTVEEAQKILTTCTVIDASLDHDLGLQFDENGDQSYERTGYDLVRWMAETGNWPCNPPTVHSMNPVGRKNMQDMIDRYFGAIGRDALTSDEQLRLWVNGESVHNTTPDECCPDFSCCRPELLADKETRILFSKADEQTRHAMLFGFLGAALSSYTDKKIYIAGQSHEKEDA
jgi:hypothetical protein